MRPSTLPSGAVLQTGMRPKTVTPPNPMGLLMRGVVVATYVTDDPQNPYNTAKTTPYAVYCDVLTYGPAAGGTPTLVTKAIVSQERAGIQDGSIWRPRAATLDVSGQPLSLAHSNLMDLDGDHVLLGFIDGTYQTPVILRSLPHPQADVGQSQAEPSHGQPMRLKQVDGAPDLDKHLGVVHGVDARANFVVRTLYANDGSLTAKGAQPAPAQSPEMGNVVLQMHAQAQRLSQWLDMGTPASPAEVLREVLSLSQYHLQFAQQAAHWSVSDRTGNTLEAKGGGAQATVQVGDGARHVAIVEELQTMYAQLKVTFDAHVHSSALGPSLSASLSGFVAPAWDNNIASSHVSIPSEK